MPVLRDERLVAAVRMSTGTRVDWNVVGRALADAGLTMTEHGAKLAKVRTVCAWCRTLINDGPLGVEGHESHGICQSCERIHFPEAA